MNGAELIDTVLITNLSMISKSCKLTYKLDEENQLVCLSICLPNFICFF